jgi:ATP-dependent Lon protease
MGITIRVGGKPLRLDHHLPLLPLRDVVIFPGMSLPLFVGRPSSLASVERALTARKILLAVAQRRPEVSRPERTDLHETGTILRILQVFRLPDGTMRLLVEGLARARLREISEVQGGLNAEIALFEETARKPAGLPKLLQRAQTAFAEYAELHRRVPEELRSAATESEDAVAAAYLMGGQILQKVAARQELLEATDPAKRLRLIVEHLGTELEILRLERQMRGQLSVGAERGKARSSVRELLRSIQPELGGEGDPAAELEELESAISAARMPQRVHEKATRELERLCRMPLFSPEATVTRTYLGWLIAMPWHKQTRDRRRIAEAERILEEDHFGLARVKERILEHLAVVQLSRAVRGPVLCLVGPPGVGKTSLGRSVARALNRRFVRMSLGGVRDEAEIRGHRRTYIGSMPGRILQAMRRAGTVNPVILLDEVDKLGLDYRGDPAAALLEVLDPEQNAEFSDHYLEVDYDLSNVLFLTTANREADIPYALRDRMELIQLPGYLETEKREIAVRFLLPRQREAAGLKPGDLSVGPAAMSKIIREYTREAGVRNLERSLGTICRKTARRKAGGSLPAGYEIDEAEAEKLLGVPRHPESVLERAGRIGVATGVAWTEFGGEVLLIEARTLPGGGSLILTGKLGETMQESARAAVSYVRSRAKDLGLDPKFYQNQDLHIHVPEGGVPKDGPSAGVAIALALVSALTERPTRSDVAASGEITLRGRVLPVGGLTEKAVAALRAGVRTLLVPECNRRHVEEIPEEVRRDLKIVPVSTMEEVLRRGLSRVRSGLRPAGRRKRASERLYAA